MEDGSRVNVVAIQAETCEQVIVGVRYLDGGNGVCTLAELELLAGEFTDAEPGPAV
jgi:hypothetical protein